MPGEAIPYLDVLRYKDRSQIDDSTIDLLVSLRPRFLSTAIADQSSWINSRLKKRYAVPLGQRAPVLVATGTLPPAVTLSGRPTLGCIEIVIQVTTPGALGTAVVQWSSDGGLNWTSGVLTAATVAIGATGLVASFAAGTYAADNVYAASTPVPRAALRWLAALLDVAVWEKKGVNPTDPQVSKAYEAADRARAEMKEAADSKEGLFDLPTNDAAGDSAITQGGLLSYSESSPYVWQDVQRCAARGEDRSRFGTSGSTDS